uniref:Uncharacterized protein n=1 Tax=Phytophthora ramorum TaxID=164328 RepID=H3GTL5_PHYRM
MANNAALTDKHSRIVTSLKQHVAALSRTMSDDVLSNDKYLRAMAGLQQHVVRLSSYTERLVETYLPNWAMQQAGDAALKETYSRAVAALEQRVAVLSRTMADGAASIKDKGSCAVTALEQHLATFFRYSELVVADARKVNQPRADWTMQRLVEMQRMFERDCRLEAQRTRGHRMVAGWKKAPTHESDKDPRVAKLEGEVAALERNNEQLTQLQRKYETEAKEAAGSEQVLSHKVATLKGEVKSLKATHKMKLRRKQTHQSEVSTLKATHKSEVANIRSVHSLQLDDFDSFRRSSKEAMDKVMKELEEAKAEAVQHGEVGRSLRKEKDAIEDGVMTALGLLDILEQSWFGKIVEVSAETQQRETSVKLEGEVAALERNNEQLTQLQRKYETEAKEAAGSEQVLSHKVATHQGEVKSLKATHKMKLRRKQTHQSEVSTLKVAHKSEVANIRSVHSLQLDDFDSFRRSSKEAMDKVMKELEEAKAEAVQHGEVIKTLCMKLTALQNSAKTAVASWEAVAAYKKLLVVEATKSIEVPVQTQQQCDVPVMVQEQRASGDSSSCSSPSTVSSRSARKATATPVSLEEVEDKAVEVPAQVQQHHTRKQELTLPDEIKRAPANVTSSWMYMDYKSKRSSSVGTSSTSSSPEISPRSTAWWPKKAEPGLLRGGCGVEDHECRQVDGMVGVANWYGKGHSSLPRIVAVPRDAGLISPGAPSNLTSSGTLNQHTSSLASRDPFLSVVADRSWKASGRGVPRLSRPRLKCASSLS